jgi:hypothetical protein
MLGHGIVDAGVERKSADIARRERIRRRSTPRHRRAVVVLGNERKAWTYLVGRTTSMRDVSAQCGLFAAEQPAAML